MKNPGHYGIVPVTYAMLASELEHYKSPKDKISRFEKEGQLIRLKKGLYLSSSGTGEQLVSVELIANNLYGPSYVSFESALSWHGLIPERTYLVKSATTKRKKHYRTPVGDFEYITVPETYFAEGLHQIIVEDSYAFIIATPEKALCDLVISTSGLRFQSKKAIRNYLFEDLRIDSEQVGKMDAGIIKECAETGYKKQELKMLLQFVMELKSED